MFYEILRNLNATTRITFEHITVQSNTIYILLMPRVIRQNSRNITLTDFSNHAYTRIIHKYIDTCLLVLKRASRTMSKLSLPIGLVTVHL